MKRIPTFVSDDNGSIIHIIKKTIKNYSSMKAMHLIYGAQNETYIED